ncbi:aspartate 1-decarboxylase autocleavage activator PanM [Erwinia tracheiphila]|uniref:PanD regulatory factor n=1 Tax=Erwinia tracheiphila TaxID=65700 RepID=A0A0M2KGV9_9GAMM|nr:aspartate 1-decarboxylase autocleavage activator PanM [Erwinia tracheiphila]AXF78576.1 aspartate 1-decarboxylase autocleavage activator PanM [Erwinia tracheiphila]EOS93652.1 acetyltransferase [Erwinia tracheiphila PSU-1]KKF36458.1 acetyltransferase [Erwinia tracheiphila]UIA82691.1 aspartate 1-decarboxylase autocleavage activator PanM [Erwinia tracheiphila]UIA87791.1 aspartate 1-decarboxylase autocleavage activator PanM [Erwinia tracheiphila]
MKLTIIRLQHFSDRDRLDLAKIWPAVNCNMLEDNLDQAHRLYAAKFNDRLLAAVKVTVKDGEGEMHDFMVREVTRRRGVGKYLLEEVLAQNNAIRKWRIASNDFYTQEAASAFMRSCGFETLARGWEWRKD